jgi:hypothetical protein
MKLLCKKCRKKNIKIKKPNKISEEIWNIREMITAINYLLNKSK